MSLWPAPFFGGSACARNDFERPSEDSAAVTGDSACMPTMPSEPSAHSSNHDMSSPLSWHLNATVSVPGSKSLTNRYLILAALSEPRPGDSPIRLTAPLVARDTLLMAQALESLGVRIGGHEGDACWDIYPPKQLHPGTIDCGLAGTVMRFIPPVAALADGVSVLDGDTEARLRPMGAVIDGVRQLGIQVREAESSHHLPIAVHGSGEVSGGRVTIDASASSQFVSGLLLAGARFRHGLDLRHSGGELPSLPHISMTVQTLRAAGVQVTEFPAAERPNRSKHSHDIARWVVEPGTISQPDIVIEPDLSNAAPFLAAAMVTGGRVRIPYWPAHTTQPGAQLPSIFERMGGRARFYSDSHSLPHHGQAGDQPYAADLPGSRAASAQILEISGPDNGMIAPLTMDLHAVGELVPTIAAVAAFAQGTSRLGNIGQLRGHETNRLAAIVQELSKIGVNCWEDGDDLVIVGRSGAFPESSNADSDTAAHASPRANLTPAGASANTSTATAVTIESYADHRMATFGAILGLRIPHLTVRNIETTAKTLPNFVTLWEGMLKESETS